MNMMKKTGGFTLVELIVVIAILAILAGVAVPAYSGYIKKANVAADTTALGAVKTAVLATLATNGTVSEIEVTAAGGAVSAVTATYGEGNTEITLYSTGTNGTVNEDFATYYGSTTIPALKAWTSGANWTVEAGWVDATAAAGE